jgi:hypothetical protein
MDLTDRFTWEDLPTRDPDTGYLTAAGWISLIKMCTTRAAVAMLIIHSIQSTTRIVTNHETMYIAWYPFDWTISPFYELVNISQVKISIYENNIILIKVIILSLIKASRFISHFRSSLSLFFHYDAVSFPDYIPG